MNNKPLGKKHGDVGFTLLEVMVAMTIIAIAFAAVLGSQSQGVSLANEAKFNTTAPLLAQSKMAEIEMGDPADVADDSGDFGEDFPGYTWQLNVKDVVFGEPENVSDRLRQFDLEISWGEGGLYQYSIRRYRFSPKAK